MKKGKLIVIEGASDGIGKTTQFELLKKGKNVVTCHFPSYGTVSGAPVEEYLKGNFGAIDELSPYFITSLYAIDRAIVWNTKLKQAYLEGKNIILDRYTTSSLFYQSALIEDLDEKKKFIDYVTDFEYNKLGIKKPDLVIFLYAPFSLVTKIRNNRKQNEGIKNDIHERNLEFMKKVYDNALFVADYLSWNKINCSNESGMRSISDIHEEISKLIKKYECN